jgi:hypothetical protein
VFFPYIPVHFQPSLAQLLHLFDSYDEQMPQLLAVEAAAEHADNVVADVQAAAVVAAWVAAAVEKPGIVLDKHSTAGAVAVAPALVVQAEDTDTWSLSNTLCLVG